MASKRAGVPPDFIDVRAKGKRHPNVSAIRRHELVVTSGKILACDPSAGKRARPIIAGVKPGKYPVFLYVPRHGGVGFAELRFSDGTVARWEKAPAYSSLVGFGCFADEGAGLLEHYRRVEAEASDSYVEDVLNAALKKEGGQFRTGSRTTANVVLFNCAYSDVQCRNFRGFDARGRLVCVVTDTGILEVEQKTADTGERKAKEAFAQFLANVRSTLGSALLALGFVEGEVTYTSKKFGTKIQLPFPKGRIVIRVEAEHFGSLGVRMPNIWIGHKGRKQHFDALVNIAKDAGVKKVPMTDNLESIGEIAKMMTKHFAAIEPKLDDLLEKSRIRQEEGADEFDAWLKEATARRMKEMRIG